MSSNHEKCCEQIETSSLNTTNLSGNTNAIALGYNARQFAIVGSLVVPVRQLEKGRCNMEDWSQAYIKPDFEITQDPITFANTALKVCGNDHKRAKQCIEITVGLDPDFKRAVLHQLMISNVKYL